jgi:nucleoside-diphosphate-sugar epimerase
MEGIALVTGAESFKGRWMLHTLAKRGLPARAAVRTLSEPRQCDAHRVLYDPFSENALRNALEGVRVLYHFAELERPGASWEDLLRYNVEETKILWTAAARSGVRTAVYCSSAAVYGLLALQSGEITEETRPRAVEAFGRSKFEGEREVLRIGLREGIYTVIIRPVTVLGPGDQSLTARALRRAAFSSFLLARAANDRKFSFVHVQDVAEAALHLAESVQNSEKIYNVVTERAVTFEEAFQVYLRVLKRLGRSRARAAIMGRIADGFRKLPAVSHTLERYGGRLGFPLWRPEFYLTYSSQKLLDTSFHYRWSHLEDVLVSCLRPDPLPQ